MAADPLSREREIVLQRFLELTPADQFQTYRAIRDLLAARLTLAKKDDAVEERGTSLDIFKRVTEHLELPDGVAPTPAQFDAVCGELDLGWNRSRVGRAWGRWRFGKEAFLGHDHDSAIRRGVRRAISDGRRRHEAPLHTIRLWLATNPANRGWRAYTVWARDYNSELQEGDLPVVQSASNFSLQLGMRWPDLVRYAANEITAAEARPPIKQVIKRYCRGPYDLVTRADLVSILGCSKWTAGEYAAQHSFPLAVVVLPGARLWIRSDIKAYSKKRPFPERRENEFRSVYMTADEAAEAAGVPLTAVRRGHRDFPEAAVSFGAVKLWLRSEVEAWRSTG